MGPATATEHSPSVAKGQRWLCPASGRAGLSHVVQIRSGEMATGCRFSHLAAPGQPRESPGSGLGLQRLLIQSQLGEPRQVKHFLICKVPTHVTVRGSRTLLQAGKLPGPGTVAPGCPALFCHARAAFLRQLSLPQLPAHRLLGMFHMWWSMLPAAPKFTCYHRGASPLCLSAPFCDSPLTSPKPVNSS